MEKDTFKNFEQLFSLLPVHIYLIDVKGYYQACNELQAKNFGFNNVRAVIGKTNYEIPIIKNNPVIIETIENNNKKVFTQKIPVEFYEPYIKSDGTLGHCKSYKIPILENNEVIGLIGISFDISKETDQLKNLEEQIAETELKLSHIIDNLPEHIYWLDRNNIFLGCNAIQAQDFGLKSSDEIKGLHVSSFQTEKNTQTIIENNNKLFITGRPLTAEEKFQDREGNEVYYLSKKVPLTNRTGDIIGILGISVDITAQKNMEESLRQAKEKAEAASHAKSEFIANMSHDIRTPLTGILGFSDQLQNDIQSPNEKKYALAIYRSGKQLLKLLNDVIEVITVDTATDDKANHNSFDLRQTIEDLFKLELPAVEAKHLEFWRFIDDDIPDFVVSDRLKIHRILLNLLGNAIKFTNEGYIELAARLILKTKKSVTIEFSVKDTGIGIPQKMQDKVFDKFFKVSPSYKGKYPGNGIGLHIVQKFVGLLGGAMRFSSVEGKGTTFSFELTLPIGEEPTEIMDETVYREQLRQEKEEIYFNEEPLFSEASNSVHSTNKAQILLVEDNIMALKTLRLQMNVFDVEVTEALDGETGLELIKKQPFDLIITDIGLPGISGDEMVQIVRDFEKKEDLKPQLILGLTGHAIDGEFGKLCSLAGINKLYQKPMTPDVLKKIMEPLLKESKKELEINNEKLENASLAKDKKEGCGLGVDLPDTEAELFEISHHPLFDIQIGIDIIGSEEIVREMMKDFKRDTLGEDLEIIKQSHQQGDWETIRRLTHKIKGGSCYGTVRLYNALLYMERYLKAGHINCAEDLYTQMLRVIDETVDYLENEAI